MLNLRLLLALHLLYPTSPIDSTNKKKETVAWRDDAHESYINFSSPGSYPVFGEVDLSIIADQARKRLPDNAVIITDCYSLCSLDTPIF